MRSERLESWKSRLGRTRWRKQKAERKRSGTESECKSKRKGKESSSLEHAGRREERQGTDGHEVAGGAVETGCAGAGERDGAWEGKKPTGPLRIAAGGRKEGKGCFQESRKGRMLAGRARGGVAGRAMGSA